MPTPAAIAARRRPPHHSPRGAGRLRARPAPHPGDDHDDLARGGAGGQFIGVCLSGFTLLFVLHTSDARRRTFRAAVVIVASRWPAPLSACSRRDYGSTAAGLIGLMLAFAAPVIILRRILASPRITVRLVLGALAIYLLVGLTYAYLYPVIGTVTNQPFFVQTSGPRGDRLRVLQLRDPHDRRLRRLHRLHERRSDGRGVGGLDRTALPGLRGRPAGRQYRPDDRPGDRRTDVELGP